MFLHQRDTFWETTTQSPGILINDQTISQVQIKYDDIRTLASESNDCSYYKQGRVHNLHIVYTMGTNLPKLLELLVFCIYSLNVSFFFLHDFFVTNLLNVSKFLPLQTCKTLISY